MSQNFIPFKVSAPRRLPQKDFKLPVEESIKIIDEVRKIQKHTKTIRPDQDRKQYQNLLQWVKTSLQSTKQLVQIKKMSYKEYSEQQLQEQTVEHEVHMQQRRIIQTLIMQMSQIFKRECKQKCQLMQIIYEFFNQIINMYSKHYERQYIETLTNYNIQLKELEGQYGIKLNECNKRISYLESQKQTKWKNIYMLAKDNRILRRQKGKILRLVQEQDQKIKILEGQLCQLVKENEMNKLVIRFENDSENLKIFMKNRLALIKFEKIIQRFPKKAMKVLNNDLLKLQIQQLNGLDKKIDYIKRVINESGDIFDEYEDLNELINRPNKMVFNAYTQTDPEDVEPPKQYREASTNYDIEVRLKSLDTWEQIFQFKIPGWPEMREKHVHIKDPKKKYTTKPIFSNRKHDNQPKEFFLLEISSGEVHQTIHIRTKNRSQEFNRVLNTGVTFNPKLKDKTKLYFVMPYQIRIIQNDPTDNMDLILKKTLPIGTKKQKQAHIRKSENINLKQSLKNKIKSLKSPQKQRNSQTLTLQSNLKQFSEQYQDQNHQQIHTIYEKTQTDSSKKIPENVENSKSFDSIDDRQSFEMHHPNFNKKRRSIRRSIQLTPSKFDLNHNNKISIFKQQKIHHQSSSDDDANIDHLEKFLQKNKLCLNTQTSNSQTNFKKSHLALNKINRIKTSQNVRSSKTSNNKTTMDNIFEESDQNRDYHKTVNQWQSFSKPSRFSFIPSPKSLPKSKFAETFSNITNFRNLNTKDKQRTEFEGNLASRDEKNDIKNPVSLQSMVRTASKFALRNSSFNSMKFNKQRQSACDPYSIKTRISSQHPTAFNYKLYFNEIQQKKTFQILQSQILNPLTIKNFQVKKLTEKIIRNMYTRRKQLLSSQTSTSLKVFIEHFLKQIYGNNWKGEKNLLRYAFTIEDRESSPSMKSFSLMLNTNVQIEYLEDLFRLYVTMLEKNEFNHCENPLITSKAKGTSILKYLLSVYFDQLTSNEIQQNLPFMNQFEIDLNEIFIVVETHVRRYTMQTEIYGFLMKLLPENQSFIEFGQMKEILHLFKNDMKYHAHIARLKYFFKTFGKIVSQQQQALASKMQFSKTTRPANTADKSGFNSKSQTKQLLKQEARENLQILPIHRVCLYLKRYQWNDMIEINSYVQEKYHKLVGVFILEESIKFITRYCVVLQQHTTDKKTFYQSGAIGMSMSMGQQPAAFYPSVHPLSWLLSRTKEMIRNYYRYKGPLDRHLLMFVHLSILTFELDVNTNEVFSEAMGLLNLEFKKLKTKEEVDLFMRD